MLTRPENFAELQDWKTVRAIVLRDPCRVCLNRIKGWDIHAPCVTGRTFWDCHTGRTQPSFEPDYEAIEELKREQVKTEKV